jgi:hypothetical protein
MCKSIRTPPIRIRAAAATLALVWAAALTGPPTVAAETPLPEPAFDSFDGEMPVLVDEGELESPAIGRCDQCSGGAKCNHCGRSWLSFRDRVTAGAEYLLLRPSFSNATALYETTTSGQQRVSQNAINHDFGYASGLRAFAGYRLNDDWMIRFGYTSIFASSSAVGGTSTGNWAGGNGTGFVGPYSTSALAAGQSIRSSLGADLALYDLELAGRLNPGGCGPGAGGSRWEAAGAVGLRFADASVSSHVFNDQSTGLGERFVFVDTTRGFQGVGPRLAIQGRRYLGAKARWSIFASGAAALLVGSYENLDVRTTVGSDQNFQQQRAGGAIVVPNLDLSLGATWQVAQRTSFSAGWLLMYFEDLGYSEQIPTGQDPRLVPLVELVPLTNSSLAYDGFFFRLTHNF